MISTIKEEALKEEALKKVRAEKDIIYAAYKSARNNAIDSGEEIGEDFGDDFGAQLYSADLRYAEEIRQINAGHDRRRATTVVIDNQAEIVPGVEIRTGNESFNTSKSTIFHRYGKKVHSFVSKDRSYWGQASGYSIWSFHPEQILRMNIREYYGEDPPEWRKEDWQYDDVDGAYLRAEYEIYNVGGDQWKRFSGDAIPTWLVERILSNTIGIARYAGRLMWYAVPDGKLRGLTVEDISQFVADGGLSVLGVENDSGQYLWDGPNGYGFYSADQIV